MTMNKEASPARSAILRLSNLVVEKKGQIICQLKSLVVAHGSYVSVTGPNGSGKSTLLRVISGLETEFQGQFEIDISPRDCAFVPQDPLMFRGSAAYNVEYPLIARGMPALQRRSQVQQMLREFGLTELKDKNAKSLSGGEKKRIAFARAVIYEPKILLLDEPFAELDSIATNHLIHYLNQSDKTVFITSPKLDSNLSTSAQQVELSSHQHSDPADQRQ